MILEQRTKDRSRAEDLAQDTLLTVLVKIRKGLIEQPEFLKRYVYQTGIYKHIEWLRKRGNQIWLSEDLEKTVSTHGDTNTIALDGAFEVVSEEQERRFLANVIDRLTVPRDRQLLFFKLVAGLEKEVICRELNLKSDQYDRAISRARQRLLRFVQHEYPDVMGS